MKQLKIETGIHTYSVGMTLTAKQYYKIKGKLSDFLHLNEADYWSGQEHYQIDEFEDKGVKIYLSHFQKLYLLKVRLEPCRVLGHDNPAALYQPTKESYRKLVKKTDKLLKEYSIPKSIDEMKICREDITCDLYFKESAIVGEYIRILQKSFLLPHYKRVYFREKDRKAKNAKTANRHSCRQQCKSAAFFAYNKTAQLQMIERFPDCLSGNNILRLEAELKREALKKRVGKQTDNYHYLKAGAKQACQVIRWYLKRLFRRADGSHLRYQEAVQLIQKKISKKKTRERLEYLLRKASDSQSLDAALCKTQDKFNLSNSQTNHLLELCRKLSLCPLTLPNASKMSEICNLYAIIRSV